MPTPRFANLMEILREESETEPGVVSENAEVGDAEHQLLKVVSLVFLEEEDAMGDAAGEMVDGFVVRDSMI